MPDKHYVVATIRPWNVKILAMRAYKGEDPHRRSPEVLKSLAKVRGSEGGSSLRKHSWFKKCSHEFQSAIYIDVIIPNARFAVRG